MSLRTWLARLRGRDGAHAPAPLAPPASPASSRPWVGPDRRQHRALGRLVGFEPDQGVVVWLERPVRADGRRVLDRLLRPTTPRAPVAGEGEPVAPVANLVTVAWAELEGPVTAESPDTARAPEEVARHLQYQRVEILQADAATPRVRIHTLG